MSLQVLELLDPQTKVIFLMLTYVSLPDKFGPDAEANAAVDAYNVAIVEAVARTERPITPWYGLAWAAVPGDDLVHLDRWSLDYAGNVSLKKQGWIY